MVRIRHPESSLQENNSHQTYFSTPEDLVSIHNGVRRMNAFIDKLNLQKQVSVARIGVTKYVKYLRQDNSLLIWTSLLALEWN